MYSNVFFVRLQRDGLVDKNAWWKERWPKFRSQYSCKKNTALYVPLSLVLEAETGGSLDLLYDSPTPGSVRNPWGNKMDRARHSISSSRLSIPTRNYMHSERTHTLITYTHTQIHMQTICYRLYFFKYSPGSNGSFNIKAGRCEIIFLSKTNMENKFIIMPLKYQHCIFSVISQKYTRLLVHQ